MLLLYVLHQYADLIFFSLFFCGGAGCQSVFSYKGSLLSFPFLPAYFVSVLLVANLLFHTTPESLGPLLADAIDLFSGCLKRLAVIKSYAILMTLSWGRDAVPWASGDWILLVLLEVKGKIECRDKQVPCVCVCAGRDRQTGTHIG